VKLPRTVKVRVDPLPVSAVEAIRAEMPARLQSAVTLAAGAGLRQGEVLGVTVDRVDFLRRELTIDRQLVTVTGREPHLARATQDDGQRANDPPTQGGHG
jgi:integrase